MSQTVVYTHTYDYRQFLARARQPIVTVQLFYNKNVWRGDALLDTGADYSIFDATIAERLGIALATLRKERISGVGGTQLLYKLQRIGVRIGPMLKPAVCQVYFVEGLNKHLPNAVGRTGLFDHLQIGLDEANKKVYMTLKV